MPRAQVVIELASDARFARDLAAGGVFVPGCALPLAEECDLLVCGANREITLPARVVYVDAYRGAGLELLGFSPELKAELATLEPVGRPEVEVVDEPVVFDAGFDRGGLDELAADDDLAYAPAESVAVIDLDALVDAAGDDLAIPIGEPGRAPTGELRVDRAATALEPAEPGDDDDDAGATIAFDASAMARTATMDADTFALTRSPTADDPELGRAATVDLGAFDADARALAEAQARTATIDAGAYIDPGATLVGALADPRALPALAPDPEPDEASAAIDGDGGDPGPAARARALHERLRGLTLAAQHRLAATGELQERILLERLYGKTVWEPLLRNPRLTPPEVSRIARSGLVPRVLLELIVDNPAWLAVPEVRRALLSNPRLGAEQIQKVLRLAPRHELKLASTQAAYPHAVRTAARQLIAQND